MNSDVLENYHYQFTSQIIIFISNTNIISASLPSLSEYLKFSHFNFPHFIFTQVSYGFISHCLSCDYVISILERYPVGIILLFAFYNVYVFENNQSVHMCYAVVVRNNFNWSVLSFSDN